MNASTDLAAHEHAGVELRIRLLADLTRGFRAYRLFPGDPERPAFLEAVKRVKRSTSELVSRGAVEIDVQGGSFHGPDGPLEDADSHGLLAEMLYEHGAERLIVIRPPSAQELLDFYAELAAPRDADLGERLVDRGVEAFVVAERAPLARLPGEYDGDDDLGGYEELFSDPVALQLAAGVEDGGTSGGRMFDLVRQALAAQPDPAAVIDLMSKLARTLRGLAPDARRAFYELVIRQKDDETAAVIRAALTDTELAEAIADLALADGEEALEIAQEVIDRDERQRSLLALTQAAVTGGRDQTGVLIPVDPGVERSLPVDLVAGARIPDAPSDEVRADFSLAEDRVRDIAQTALRDILSLEDDSFPLRRVLWAWTMEMRAALERRDREELDRLARILTLDAASRDEATAAIVRDAWDDVLTVTTVHALLPEDRAADLAPLLELLEPFGAVAVDRIFEVLAEEQDRTRRSRLIELFDRIVPGNIEVLDRWLEDPRWHVARNAVTVMSRIQDPAVLPRLQKALVHPEERVSREAIRALVNREGASALSTLAESARTLKGAAGSNLIRGIAGIARPEAARELAGVASDAAVAPDVREEAIAALGQHSHASSRMLLERLVADRSALPWRLRRHARAALSRDRRRR